MRFMTMLALASGLLLATTTEASAFGRRGKCGQAQASSSCGSSGGYSSGASCGPCQSGFATAGFTSGAPCTNCPTGFTTQGTVIQQESQPIPSVIIPGQAPPIPMTPTRPGNSPNNPMSVKELPQGAIQVYWHPQHGFITIQK